MEPGRKLRPAFHSNPGEPVLDEVPGRKQAVLIPCAGSRGRPVGLEPRESRRVKTRHGRADRRGLALGQRDDWLLSFDRQVAHGNSC